MCVGVCVLRASGVLCIACVSTGGGGLVDSGASFSKPFNHLLKRRRKYRLSKTCYA